MKENKKVRKHAFDQESELEKKKKKERKHALDQEKREKLSFLFSLINSHLRRRNGCRDSFGSKAS